MHYDAHWRVCDLVNEQLTSSKLGATKLLSTAQCKPKNALSMPLFMHILQKKISDKILKSFITMSL